MSCCCPHARCAGRIFSLFAGRIRKHVEKRGLSESQKQLLAGLEQAGFAGASVLEIGSGVGYFHQTLLEKGAATATGVDLAPRALAEARRWAEDRGLGERVQYREGDFVELAEEIEAADVTVLDKVICCYPDADRLVHRSLARTRRVYALTYPRSRWFTRLGAALMAVVFKMFFIPFRNYVHDPEQVEAWITAGGFRKRYENQTAVWLTQVYARP